MDLGLNKLTKKMIDIKHSADGSTVLNNKYFNYKDGLFLGVVGAGSGVGYMLGPEDKKKDMAVNGGLFGVGMAAIGRYGNKNMLRDGLSGMLEEGGILQAKVQKMFTPKAEKEEFYKNAVSVAKTKSEKLRGEIDKISGKSAAYTTLGILGLTGLVVGLGGAAGGAAGMDTNFSGGFAEGVGLTSMIMGVAAISARRAAKGGVNSNILANSVAGKVTSIGGGIYGGYDEWNKKDSTFADVMLKGAVYAKVGMGVGALGMERYGNSIVRKLSKGG